MIYNQRKIGEKIIDIHPTAKQNKYLLSIGSSNAYGINYNGYGYSDTVRVYELTVSQVRQYNKLGKLKIKRTATAEEKQIAWEKRLANLTGISIEEAHTIAEEKKDYQFDKIQMMIERDNNRPSRRRSSLIGQMERENPLRRIESEDHAQAILEASRRHNDTNYEDKLEEARDKASWGEIDRADVKEYARANMQ